MPREASNGNVVSKFEGELSSVPRGPLVTALLAITGILLVREVLSLIGRYVLNVRRPTEVLILPNGLEVRSRTLMLDRVLREQTSFLPREGLVRITREVRFPRLSMYAGLIGLAIGSYLGVGLVVDGLRAASPSMFGTGLLIAILGLALDFALSSLSPGLAGRTRVVLVPRRGSLVSVALVNPDAADLALAYLSQPRPRSSVRPAPIEPAARADALAEEPEHDGAGNS